MKDINNLISLFSRLPGIGKKSASRIAYFLLKNKDISLEISKTIEFTINNVKNCSICGNFTTNNPCDLCTDEKRDKSIICIVEDPKDLLAIEETHVYYGQYHILMGNLNPLEGIGPEKLRISELIKRIEKSNFSEVLIATNPTIEGEATFLYINKLLEKYKIKRSRIATGLPIGGNLEYSDKLTLGKSIQSKHYL
jgi:recombination protein RecR